MSDKKFPDDLTQGTISDISNNTKFLMDNGSVPESIEYPVLKKAINDNTAYDAKTMPESADTILIWDSINGVPMKIPVSDLAAYVRNNSSLDALASISDTDVLTIISGGVAKKVTAGTIKSYINNYKPGNTVSWANQYYTSGFLYDNKLSLYYNIQLPNKIDASVASAVLTGTLVAFNGDGGSMVGSMPITASNTVCTLNKDIGAIVCKTTISAPSNTANGAAVLINVLNSKITFS